MFCYVKDGELVTTSNELIQKRQEQVLGEIESTRAVTKTRTVKETEKNSEGVDQEIEHTEEYQDDETYMETVVITPFIDGMAYDEVIETGINGRVAYENGKVVSWEESEEKQNEDRSEQERKNEWIKNRPAQILSELGNMKLQKDGLELLGEDTVEIENKIKALREEYVAMNTSVQ